VILRSPLGRRFLFSLRALLRAVWCFIGIALFFPLKIDQRKHRAIDFVIGGAMARRKRRGRANPRNIQSRLLIPTGRTAAGKHSVYNASQCSSLML